MHKINILSVMALLSFINVQAAQHRTKAFVSAIIEAATEYEAYAAQENDPVAALQKQLQDMLAALKMISDKKTLDADTKEQLLKEAAAAQQSIQSLQVTQVVTGDIFLVRNHLKYFGKKSDWYFESVFDEQGKLFEWQPQDILVEVWTTSKECSDWSSHTHPQFGRRFPSVLPLSLLDGKQEGDIISFYFKNEQNELVQVKLTCNQNKYKYHDSGPFHKTLSCLKYSFALAPCCQSANSEEFLLKLDVLMRNPQVKENDWRSKYFHGPNGFKLS